VKSNCLLVLTLAFLASVHQVVSQVAFAPAVSYTVGVSPGSVIAADLNGDGKVDLVCANYGFHGLGNTLSVLTNNGSGVFGSNATLNVGGQPRSVIAADVNGDGKLDLISANYNGNSLSVLTNNGYGGFVLASSPSVGGMAGREPTSVTAADVNNDGKVDLICSDNYYNGGSGKLVVFTNDGTCNFVIAATYDMGLEPWSVTAADVNGDGKVDLICANAGDSTLMVLTNDGSGGFALSSTLGVGVGPGSVTTADVNGDGKLDLICANDIDGTLSVLTNDGSGGFVFASTINVGTEPRSVVAADVNGDGKVDLISANVGDNTLTVLTNDGSGGFTLAVTLGVGSFPNSVTAADVNGDGRVDLICPNGGPYANTLGVLMNVPMLAMNPLSNSMLVSWGSSWTNWSLQQNSDLTTTNWSTSDGIFDDGTNKCLMIQSPSKNLFFRLSHP